MNNNPANDLGYAHILLYGLSGVGKSSLAATAETPQLVDLFDSLGNARWPYMRGMRVVKSVDPTPLAINGKYEFLTHYDCYAAEDTEKTQLIRRIRHFSVVDPTNPIGVHALKIKLPLLPKDCQEINAKSYIFDSLLPFHIQTKHSLSEWQKLPDDEINQVATNHYEDLCSSLAGLPITTIVISHLSTQGQQTIREGKKYRARKDVATTAPGRMGSNIFAFFGDVWLCFIDEEGNYCVQTKGDNLNVAKNTFDAPEICLASWAEITKNQQPIISE